MDKTIPREREHPSEEQKRGQRGRREEKDTLVTEERLLSRIVVNPKIMVGKPVIRGTRVPVEHILKLEAQGLSLNEILREFPHLKKDDIMAALLYAAKVMSREEVYPVTE
jgi:uncharacterized protein (DUF433 family)